VDVRFASRCAHDARRHLARFGATEASNTTISTSDANRCVSHAVQLLIKDGQIAVPPQPSEIINGFVGAHLLKRSGDELEFQHQLFQEWYASYEVESLMRTAIVGEVSAKKRLREDVLNWLRWEEPSISLRLLPCGIPNPGTARAMACRCSSPVLSALPNSRTTAKMASAESELAGVPFERSARIGT
jgi:hypothetical protein